MDRVRITKISNNEQIKNFSFADTVFIEITRKCNLRCIHCLNNSGNNISVRINSVVMKNNIEDIIELSKLFNNLKIKMYIRRFVNSGRAKDLNDLSLTKEDYEYLKNELSDIVKDGYVDGHYLHKGDGVKLRIQLPFKVEGCRAVKRSFAIGPNWDIYPCGFLAAQNFPIFNNVHKVKDWRRFWYEIQNNVELVKLRKIGENQKTQSYCLANIFSSIKDIK